MPTDLQLTSNVQNMGQNLGDAFNRGDFAGLGALFAKDAVMLPPGSEAVAGQSNIQMFWGRARRIQELHFESTAVKPLGPDAMRETGVVRLRLGNGQRVNEVVGKYLLVWQRTDGEWKVEACVWNRDGGGGQQGGNRQGQGRGQGGGQGRGQGGGQGRGQGGGQGRGQGGGGQGGGGQSGGRGGQGGGRGGQGGGGFGGGGQGGVGGQGGGQGRNWRGGGGGDRTPPPFVPRVGD
jgi:ketosteroid isomerase-like protein